ncbi:sigma-70 family RNA polymerase sigma factor [Aurantiacibacter suaedae]|uniref:sigma-70 family RNA polymerase sigma factor n=1 Tax=Aurantiacibacter suaedae TaxID=2545755 RepID=UPI0010F6F309|nr:sigma-70 family RNA polymerase sigma factor [Aurantiacibacter suaedae]
MVKSSAINGTIHNNAKAPCPNSVGGAHTPIANASASLTRPQIRAALTKIDIGPGSRLKKCAGYRAFTADICADDLLQEAILRAMTSRRCPAGLAIEHFLMGIMRSIASEIIAKRERATEALLGLCQEGPAAPLSPDEGIAFTERAEACRQSLDEIVEGSPVAEGVLDGIDQGLCGKALAQFAGIDQAKLATVRKFIVRRSAIAWIKLEKLDEAA